MLKKLLLKYFGYYKWRIFISKLTYFCVFILNNDIKISLFFYFSTRLYIIIVFRFVGRPGRYVYVFEGYRMEEVSTYETKITKKILYMKKYV